MPMPPALVRRLVVPLLLAAASPVAAEGDWARAGERPAGAVFVDQMSVQRERDRVRFVARVDLARAERLSRGGREFRSVIVDASAKCGSQQFATARTAYYALPGGRGDKIGEFAAPVETWHFASLPPEGSPERMMFDFVCAKAARS
jgi:hypothetical protein